MTLLEAAEAVIHHWGNEFVPLDKFNAALEVLKTAIEAEKAKQSVTPEEPMEEKSAPNVNGVPITVGSKWECRDGSPVRIICIDRKGYDHSIVGLYKLKDGNESVHYWMTNGKYDLAGCGRDLIRPWRETVWINIYERGCVGPYKSKNQAARCATGKRIACIPVTYREGEGL